MGKWLLVVLLMFLAGCGTNELQNEDQKQNNRPTVAAKKAPAIPVKTKQQLYNEAVQEKADRIDRENAKLKAIRDEEDAAAALIAKEKADEIAEQKRIEEIERKFAFERLTSEEVRELNRISANLRNGEFWDLTRSEIKFCFGAAKPLILPLLVQCAEQAQIPRFKNSDVFVAMNLTAAEKVGLCNAYPDAREELAGIMFKALKNMELEDWEKEIVRNHATTKRTYEDFVLKKVMKQSN